MIMDQESALAHLREWHERFPPYGGYVPTFDDVVAQGRDECSTGHRATDANWLSLSLDRYNGDFAQDVRRWTPSDDAATLSAIGEWHAAKPVISPETLRAIEERFTNNSNGFTHIKGPDAGEYEQILEDTANKFLGGDTESFVRDYVRKLPAGWQNAIVIYLKPDAQVVIVRWSAERVLMRDTEKWARSQTPAGRWSVLDRFYPPGTDGSSYLGVPIPPPAAIAAKVPELPAVVIPLPLVQLATCGLPRGGRVIIQGGPACAKTTVALEMAVGLVHATGNVAWYATVDESWESVCRRLYQRAGATQAEAMTMPLESIHFDNQMILIDGREHYLEDVLRMGFDTVVIDSLQEARTRAGEGRGRLERVQAAIDAIAASGVTVIATSQVIRGHERREDLSKAYGGSSVGHLASLVLGVDLKDDDITLRIVKSRHGGDRKPIALRLDRERQRVTAGADAVETRIRAGILAAIAKHGPMSISALEREVEGKAATIRATAKVMIADGTLVELGGKVARP